MITKADTKTVRPAKLLPSRIDLPEEARRHLVEVLNGRLALAIDLALQAKQAHWNVKGPSFAGLHETFDKVADEAHEFVDLIAERAVQLGGVAEGTVQTVAGRTSLSVYPGDIFEGRAHVNALASALAEFGKHVRAAITETGDLGDEDTSDIFTQVSRATDKLLWMVEAHGHTER
jgi:starvation-inducible DNA-binding protein